MNRTARVFITVFILGLLAGPMAASTVEEMLEKRALTAAFNPVVLEYLLAEGAESLPEASRKEALDQMVSALKQDIDITPEEQRAASMAAAASALGELFGGGDGGELAAAAGDATYDIWKGWVDSAFALQRAGYTDEANGFFEKCVEIYPYGDLRGRCALGLAVGKPAEAFGRLMSLTDDSDRLTVNTALRLLGKMVASDGALPERRQEVVTHLTGFTAGLKKGAHGVAACHALVATGDPSVKPVLTKLSTGLMNRDFQPCAQRGLLITFGDRSVVPVLEKKLKGGKFSTVEPVDRLRAATVLMEAGEAAGFAWATTTLGRKKKKGGLKRLMQVEKEPDFQPAVVDILADIGGEQALAVLRQGFSVSEPGSWIRTMIAIAMLELDDQSQIELVRQALRNPDWDFTAVRGATALARQGDLSGISALERLYDQAARGVEPQKGRAVVAFLAGRSNEHTASRDAKEFRLRRLKRSIAYAAGSIGGKGVALLLEILGDTDPSVRSAAAFALTRVHEPNAMPGLRQALGVDFGSSGDAPYSPVVHATLLRHAASAFSDDPESRALFTLGSESPFPSVRFLALCALH